MTFFYSTLFCCGGKANLVHFTLFYSTLLTLTDGQNDRRRNKYTRFTWAGRTFFPVVLLCQFLFWQEIGLGCTYYYVLRVPYSCGVVLVFWFWQEIVFGVTYVLRVQYSCAVVSFFCCGGKVNLVRIFLLNWNFHLVHRKFSSRAYAIVPQKYRELSMQVETRE